MIRRYEPSALLDAVHGALAQHTDDQLAYAQELVNTFRADRRQLARQHNAPLNDGLFPFVETDPSGAFRVYWYVLTGGRKSKFVKPRKTRPSYSEAKLNGHLFPWDRHLVLETERELEGLRIVLSFASEVRRKIRASDRALAANEEK